MKPNNFILIVDCDGDAVDIISANTTDDFVFSLIRYHDKNDDYPPHAAWMWDGIELKEYK